jgi:hypothetical protein
MMDKTENNNEADYLIDYENGIIPLSDLPIGARVTDSSWVWEYRYSTTRWFLFQEDETKPVTWIVVAKDHYYGLESHATLLAKELIGLHAFDNSTDRGSRDGNNHWGKSGKGNATFGVRPWLNATGIHSSEGFYQAFSESFKGVVLTTTVPNREWKNGVAYSTEDHVFLPSTTELGDSDHEWTYPTGFAYPYFCEGGNARRIALIGEKEEGYWTRSPSSSYNDSARYALSRSYENLPGFTSLVTCSNGGLRPALNLKSGTLVSEIRD